MEPGDGERERERQEAVAARWELLNRISNWLDQPMAFLALIWVIVLVAELADAVPPQWRSWALWLDTAIWLAFLAQFLLELIIAPRRVQYVRDNWVIALSVALPFLRVVRLVRALSALRSVSLLRIVLGTNRATRGAEAFLGRYRFQYVVTLVMIVALAGAAGAYAFEAGQPGSRIDSFGTALWWAATLITTINVGIEPVTFEGRVIGIVMRVIALALFGYITGSVASYFVGREEERAGRGEGVRALRRQIESLERSVERLRRDLAERERSAGK